MADTKRATGSDRLTDTAIKAWLRKPGADALHDGGGLYLRRRAGGAFWSLRQVNPLTNARTWAGLFPDVPYPAATLADARRKADQARLSAATQPTDIVRARKATLTAKRAEAAAAALDTQRRLTVRQLFERWAAADLTPHMRGDGKRAGRKDGGQYVREQFERYIFPTLGEVAAPDVRKADVLAILDAVKAEGKLRTANMLLADVKQMLRFGVEREVIPQSPVESIKKRSVGGADVERDRVLTPDEVTALAKSLPLSSMQRRSALAVWLILATGCRIGELMGAEWRHVDTVARTLYLPDTKNQRDHTIHLSHFAMRQIEVLAALRENDDHGQPVPWLFPNSAGQGPVCIKSFGKQLADRQRDPSRRLTNRAKDTNSLVLAGGRWTAHDLRRTAATVMAGLGVSTDTIDECLNHKLQSKVARVYIKDRRLGEQAQAFDALGARLASLVEGIDAFNVVQLRAA